MSRLFDHEDTGSEDTSLKNTGTIFKGKTVLWDVAGESEPREGHVKSVSRDHKTQKIMLHVEYQGDGDEQGFNAPAIQTKVLADNVRLKSDQASTANWNMPYPS